MIGWTTVSLCQIGQIVTGKTPPTNKKNNYGSALPFVTPTDMDGRRIIEKTLRYLSEEGANCIKSSVLNEPAILVSCIGSDMGKTVITNGPCATNQQINSIIVSDSFDRLYTYYNLSMRQDELRNLAGGAAQPILNKTDFGKLLIDFPPLYEQQKISSILGALDDKIELNRQMNETLEAMARAIFKDWFVDFGPTRAKMEGRAPYLAPDIWSLFPDRLDDEGKPEGWMASQLGDVSDVSWGDTSTTKAAYVEKGFPAYSASGQDGFLNRADYDQKGIVLSAIGANCGQTWFVSGKWSCIKNTIRILEKNSKISMEYIYLATRDTSFWPKRGSAQPFISQADARRQLIIVPSKYLLDVSTRLLECYFERISLNLEEIRTLSVIIDLLLPKLMSGEVQVHEAESILEKLT